MFEIDLLLAGYITAGVTVGVWLLTALYRWVFKMEKPDNNVLKVLAFIASVILAYFVQPVPLPEFAGDPVAYAVGLLTIATMVFKVAQVLYDFIWKKILELISPALVG